MAPASDPPPASAANRPARDLDAVERGERHQLERHRVVARLVDRRAVEEDAGASSLAAEAAQIEALLDVVADLVETRTRRERGLEREQVLERARARALDLLARDHGDVSGDAPALVGLVVEAGVGDGDLFLDGDRRLVGRESRADGRRDAEAGDDRAARAFPPKAPLRCGKRRMGAHLTGCDAECLPGWDRAKRVLRSIPPPEGLERRDAPAGLLAPGSSYSRHLPDGRPRRDRDHPVVVLPVSSPVTVAGAAPESHRLPLAAASGCQRCRSTRIERARR